MCKGKKYTVSDVSKAERHNERKNETYENMNVIEERIPYNVHFKKPTAPTYMEQLKQMETDGQVSLRGLRKDATLFNEIVIDVNTMYFERNGGYEYAKQFYEEAYRFIEEKFGSDNVISAVMHADEINIAATEELGKEVYHYHLHAMVLPVVEKEILWSKRCKDPELRGTVKEVVNQISHSKKWKSDIPLTDEKGKPLLRKNGKPKLSELHEIEGVVEYAADEMKTEKRAYVTCLHLHSEETAAQEFMETKRLMHNEGGRSCYHGYQSFKADEVDADTAHSIGVALARELWGDRFQVVIATHCNTGHYHNHFVINSVSDVDGKKFYNSPADYRRMREVSDRLCREAKISVIEYPANRRTNYGEWMAEKNGKPTMRSRIREDIDRAILASTTEREFQRVMKEMGYEVITKTPKGSPRVHPIVRIVDGGKNFRLDKLGEYYELDPIKQRIQNNYRRKTPFPEVAEDTKAPYYQYKEKAKKASGLYALYLYYCYELHIIVHQPASVKKVSAFLREDVTKLDRYIAQADFLAKTGIETVEALAGYKAEKEKQVEALTQQRTGLKNELKRHIRKEDFQSAEATRARIAELTTELKTCRKEITLCSDIADRSEQVRKSLEQIDRQKIERKERTENELLVRRSSRAGREDDAQRR